MTIEVGETINAVWGAVEQYGLVDLKGSHAKLQFGMGFAALWLFYRDLLHSVNRC